MQHPQRMPCKETQAAATQTAFVDMALFAAKYWLNRRALRADCSALTSEGRWHMQRRLVIAGGLVLAVLLLAVGTVIILSQKSGPTPAQEKQSTLTALTAQPADTLVTLTWQPIAGASGYFVYRDRSEMPLNSTPITGSQYEDIGLTNGRVYTYTVAPAGEGIEAGTHSAEVTVSPRSN